MSAIVALCAWAKRASWDIDEDDGDKGDNIRARVVEARNEYDALQKALSLAATERQRVLSEITDAMHGPTLQPLAERVRGYVETCGRLGTEKAEALAACAEMRAALKEIIARGNEQRGTGRMIETAEAALSRPDLGAGWASPEVVAQMVGALQMVESDVEFDSLHEVTRKFVVDVLALLKRGGG